MVRFLYCVRVSSPVERILSALDLGGSRRSALYRRDDPILTGGVTPTIHIIHKIIGGTMKKRLVFFSILLVLNVLSPFASALARPTYCYDALASCVGDCNQIFSWPFNQACAGGCGIGFLGCGS